MLRPLLTNLRHPGVQAALACALLFGGAMPAAKLLLDDLNPWLVAGLLYTGSGVGLALLRLVRGAPAVRPQRKDFAPLLGGIFFGGMVGTVLLMVGLSHLPASGASLLLNSEAVFTALLAWFVFKENINSRVAWGMVAIVAGALVLTVPWGAGGVQFGELWPSLAVLGGCLGWAIDNNLTRKVALTDATWVAMVKGAVAGPVNLILALAMGAGLPTLSQTATAMIVGFFAYGLSLVLFIVGLRHLGTARTGAYYSVAPFLGAGVGVLLGEAVTRPLLIAGALMAVGVWLHLTEEHSHEHSHGDVVHSHDHYPDAEHLHDH